MRKEKDRITGHLLAEHMENERLEQQDVRLPEPVLPADMRVS